MVVVATLLFTNCERQPTQIDNTGKIGFSVSADETGSGLKSTVLNDTSVGTRYRLLISVANKDSVLVLDKKVLPLYLFGSQFVSEKIELNTGHYFLTEFMVINNEGEVVYAAPRRGSELAYLVDEPLPMDFKILPDVESNLTVEVLPVNGQSPGQFGYISFGVDVVKPLIFYAYVYNDNPLIYGPLTILPAKVVITDPEGKQSRFEFKAQVNKVFVRTARGEYTFQVKTDMYSETTRYTYSELLAATRDNPLAIPVGNSYNYHEFTIITSPDSTEDALITDLNPNENFGDVKEFSASFLTEQVLTVMRTNRSLINFNLYRYLPKSATLKKVELTLHLLGGVQMPLTDHMDTLSMAVLKAVVEPWDEHKVTWVDQPKTTDDVMMYLDYRPWLSSTQRTYDITRLVLRSMMINTPVYGYMLQHYPEDMPGGVSFASSDNEIEQMRPRIKIYYTLP